MKSLGMTAVLFLDLPSKFNPKPKQKLRVYDEIIYLNLYLNVEVNKTEKNTNSS